MSAKVEAWDKDSVIVVSNDIRRVLRVSAEVKRQAAALLSDVHPAQFTLMAGLVYLTVRPFLGEIRRITLDQDYSGNVAKRVIIRMLVEFIRRDRPTFRASSIRVREVKGSRADTLARQAYRGQAPVDGEITLADLLSVLQQ